LLAIVIAASSCKKSLPENVEEPISRQEIVEWFEGYRQKMPGAPEPVWSSAKKTFDKDLMVVRIPLESGGGEIFFGKKLYGNNLEVKFYRQVGTFDSISKNFSGYSETIDMGNYAYHKLDFINGVKVKELRSKSVNLSDDTKSGTTTFDDRPSWLSAFWDCLKLYILSVPKWDSKENEWKCSCFCSDGSSPKKLEDPLSPGGGFIFPPTFFIPPTNLIPPRVWEPFPINPGGVGSGGGIGGGNSNGTFYDPSNPFNDLANPIHASDDVIIENGVSISDVVDVPTNPKKIAQTQKRGNIEDMQHGSFGDPTGIKPAALLRLSDAQLFQKMNNLFQSCTVFDNDLSMVGDAMIQKFQNKTGGQYINNNLNFKVSQSNALINFAKQFGLLLNKRLQSTGGDINQVALIEMGNVRPIFNGLYNKFNGLQILINDTEYTDIQLDNFEIDGFGNWSADITITIHDHFGLDRNDALNYQQFHEGFPSWWLLQHTRDYIPFETIVIVRKKISSTI
jgi:hypothetical protein